MKLFLKYIYFKIKYPKSLVNYSSVISMDTKLSEGVKILHRSKLGNCNINAFTYVGENCEITNTEIGSFCSLGPGIICGLGTHPLNFVSTYPGFYSKKASGSKWFGVNHKFIENHKTIIGSDVWIGARAIIIGGVTVGIGAVIGAGAVVTKNVPPYAIVGGIPAKIIRYRFDEVIIDKLLDSKWWEKDESTLKILVPLMNNPSDFLKYIKGDFNKIF